MKNNNINLMKKINIYILKVLILTLVLSCGEQFEFPAGIEQRSPNFVSTSISASVPEEGLVLNVPVRVSFLSESETTYEVEVVTSTGASTEFTLVNAVIPANELTGMAQVNFDFDAIADEDLRSLTLKMLNPNGAPSNEVTIEYFRNVVCNDLTITITSDVWADETYFTLKDSEGNAIVDRFFPFGAPSLTPQVFTADFFLEDGMYTLEIGDTFGDAMVGSSGDVTLIGSYSLICSIITHASGEGEFSPAVADPFPGAPNAIVEVTNFTVNP